MAVGIAPKPPQEPADDTLLWTMAEDRRRLTAVVRKIDAFDALELRYAVNGRCLDSRMYRGAEIANLKPNAEAKREELNARGWSDTTMTQEPRL